MNLETVHYNTVIIIYLIYVIIEIIVYIVVWCYSLFLALSSDMYLDNLEIYSFGFFYVRDLLGIVSQVVKGYK